MTPYPRNRRQLSTSRLVGTIFVCIYLLILTGAIDLYRQFRTAATHSPPEPTAAATATPVASVATAYAEEFHGSPLDLKTEIAELTDAPHVPAPIRRAYPAKVVVNLEVRELVKRLADGVEYTFWTFGATVPGKFIRVREGDYVEFHLSNHPDSKMPHNIDLHAVTGPGGGAAASFTAPGHTSTFSFRAINPGLYVYHCATAPVGMHVANGMYGLILVQPAKGQPTVDREYYVMQGEFYTKGAFGNEGLQPFDMDKALREEADYVVFNGAVGALIGDNAIGAKVGETVRLYVGNGGPNLISSFHVIGEIFDTVYHEAGDKANHDVQTTQIPAGGAAIVEFKVEVPGSYILVDHSIFRAFNKGAQGVLKVEGDPLPEIYSGKQDDRVYLPEGSAVQSIAATGEDGRRISTTVADRIAAGERAFKRNCMACHQVDGQGVAGVFPPLAGSDFLLADKHRAIRAVANGLSGEIAVNGKKYNGVMPALQLTQEEIANTLTYVWNRWGNPGGDVGVEDVKDALTAAKP